MKAFSFSIISFFLSAALVSAQHVEFPITVSDGVNSTVLVIGASMSATDDFDVGLDQEAPPPAPNGTFDARGVWGNTDYIKDFRYYSSDIKVFELEYRAAEGESSIVLSWDNACIPFLGSFEIIDAVTGNLYGPIDMADLDFLDTSENSLIQEELLIKVTLVETEPPYVARPIPDFYLQVNFPTLIVADLDTVFNDPTPGEPLIYKAATDGNVIADVTGNLLSVSSIQGASGFSEVVVFAHDCQHVVADTIFIHLGVTSIELPDENRLIMPKVANFPNPFHDQTTICFHLKQNADVSMDFYDIIGRKVDGIAANNFDEGYHEILWTGRNQADLPLTSGIYICHFTVNKTRNILKIVKID